MRPTTFIEGFHDAEAVDEMNYSDLGTTGLRVSKIGFGTASFGSVYGNVTDDVLQETLMYALKHGVNYIDTAPWYGHGESEKRLGKALKNIPREAYYLATKVARYEKEPKNMFDFTADRVQRSVDESLERLGVEYVDVIQVHDMEFASNLDLIIKETLPALQKVVESGKAKYIGITGYPLDMFKYVLENSTVKIDTMITYCRASILDSSLLQILDFFVERGIGIINASPTCMGLLSSSGPQPWHPATDAIKKACKEAAEHCKRQGVELARLSVYYCSSHKGITMNLLGDTTVDMHKQNRQTVLEGISNDEKTLIADIQKRFFEPLPQRHWEGKEVEQYRKALKETN